MKKMLSALLAATLLLTLCLALAGCGGKEGRSDGIYGTWEGEWDYNGAHITCVMVVKEDGTYERQHTKDGAPSGEDAGDFTFDGKALITYKDTSHTSYIQYDYVDGQLTNNGHYLNKR